jgi:hypothetical protein
MRLDDLSPLAGMITGRGAMGKLIRSGVGGAIPTAIARDAYKDYEEERQAAEAAEKGMRKGGKVKKMKSGGYVKSADGCAKRGKTKGRFV